MNGLQIQRLGRGRRQDARRVGDVSASLGQRRDARTAGFSLIEMLVTVAILAIALGVAVPRAPKRSFQLFMANQQVLGDLRLTRGDALTKGDHFVLKVTSETTYEEYRMQLVGNAWVVSGPPVRSRTLPDGVRFTAGFTAGVGAEFEFNTRGLLVLPGAAQSLRLYDDHTMLTKQITVWPSGQVAPI
jgi:prepilin-type N-terminal cleavage/methylation domain-containing protein